MTCAVTGAPGSVEGQAVLAPNAGAAVVAVDAAGGVAYTAANATIGFDDNGPIYAEGVTRLSPALAYLWSYPHGRVVALDAAGNAYVAGSFTQPTDFGTGVLVPNGNIDVFLVVLSPTGAVLRAQALGLCGDDIESIAVDRTGRVAIAGDALGTVVLDASGAVQFQVAAAGKLAFDARGDLVIGGAFAGTVDFGGGHRFTSTAATDVDGFIVELDACGRFLFGYQLRDAALPREIPGYGTLSAPVTQTVVGVAVGPHDEVAFTGTYRFEIDLFGTVLTLPPSFPSGQMAGTFVAALDATGAVRFARIGEAVNAELGFGGTTTIQPNVANNLRVLPGTAIAVDASGAVVVSSNTPGNAQPPFAYPQLTRYDGATGAVTLSLGNTTGTVGYGLGVGVDACRNIVWATFANDPSLFDPHTFITKLAP